MPRTSSTARARTWPRRTITSSAAIALAGLVALIAMNEADRLIGQAVGTDGFVHALSSVIGFGAGAETGAWSGWRTASFSPAPYILVHTAFDLLFLACYGILLARLVRYAAARSGGSPRTPLLLVGLLVGVDLLEDALIVVLDASVFAANEPLGWMPVVLTAVTYAKWLVAIAIALYVLLGSTVGSTVRPAIRSALLALYAQRLGTVVVLTVGAVSLVTADGVLEQVPDVYRGWLGYPANRALGIPTFDAVAIACAFVAFLVTGLGLFALGRQRARHYARLNIPDPPNTDTRPDASPLPWLIFAIAVALAAVAIGTATLGASIDPGTLVVFLIVVLGIAGVSALLRHFAVPIAPPFKTLDLAGRAASVRRAGDFLVAAWIAIWVLGPFKALLSPLLVGAFTDLGDSRFAGSTASIAVIEVVLALLGILLPVGFRFLVARALPDVPPNSIRSTAVALISTTEPDAADARRLVIVARIALVVSAVVALVFLFLPGQVGPLVGPVAVLVALVGSWATILGVLMLALGNYKPLELFRVLRLRSTPLVTLLVVVPLVVSFVAGSAELHAIRANDAGAVQPRDTLAEAVSGWRGDQQCETTMPGSGLSVAPLLLVAAEGGGIRAATWTVDVMRQLSQDGACAANATLLSSGASGGSIGLATFRADGNAVTASGEMNTEAFGGSSALAADMAGLLAGDLVGAVSGIRVPTPSDYDAPFSSAWAWHDRTALQELSWEHAAGQFARPYDVKRQEPTGYLVLNSTDSISNCKVLVSQVDLTPNPPATVADGDSSAPLCNGAAAELSGTLDLQDYIGDCIFDLDWSTAAELSARFPFVSPAGRISNDTLPDGCNPVSDMQLVDGGLTDNSAIGTISDVAPQLTAFITAINADADGSPADPFVVPILVYVSNAPGFDVSAPVGGTRPELLVPFAALQSAKVAQVSPSAWLTRVEDGLANVCPTDSTSSADCLAAVDEVHGSVRQGIAVVAPSTSPAVAVPLGWSLSAFSRAHLRQEAEVQSECGMAAHPELDETCHAGDGYAKLGDVLDLFTDD
ncbi:MAG: hypothetical protein ABJB03_01950 [Rhodoglobus sp.]